jgi:hypothetical protein
MWVWVEQTKGGMGTEVANAGETGTEGEVGVEEAGGGWHPGRVVAAASFDG